MKIYNTHSRSIETFEPLQAGRVGLYTCGPTVYNFAHIGNYRAYMFEDILRRQLKASGLQVTQVMNLTDVDDKTIRGAREAGIPLAEFTARFKQTFFDDLATLGIERAEHYPAATDHVPEMIELVRRLEARGYAYRSADGSVYFPVAKYAAYGRLAHLDMAGLKAGARVAQDEYEKDSLADFALWKAWDEADGDVAWDSPWGRGRPGWHIECSAMSMKYLGESFDLHTGGIDNLFPHHENEIAQAEAATGKPFVKYWMHCAHLQVNGQKMSKSLGNFFTLRDLLEKGFRGREIRYVLLSAQYRQTLNFTFEAVQAARSSLERVDDCVQKLRERLPPGGAKAGKAPAMPAWVADARTRFQAAMEDDLNTPEALAALYDLVHETNRNLAAGSLGPAEADHVLTVFESMDRILGVIVRPEDLPDASVQALLDQRQAARVAKDWKRSDEIRATLAGAGWEVRDTPEGQKVRKRVA
ncbi:MAG: cysteine--tRNA ligase [Lentisphaerae bacterium RIFOXYC12_FULL_60_16]|nr:MAG: cysteine--tRNA ligase [Lentisphaerae bacterium RIFOXYC12_FULL_60_16]